MHISDVQALWFAFGDQEQIKADSPLTHLNVASTEICEAFRVINSNYFNYAVKYLYFNPVTGAFGVYRSQLAQPTQGSFGFTNFYTQNKTEAGMLFQTFATLSLEDSPQYDSKIQVHLNRDDGEDHAHVFISYAYDDQEEGNQIICTDYRIFKLNIM
ncbi:MAG: hypothetical protein KDK51_09230 [Deltaproteobacteria bacterium]|nr:hypothetical protein [Deltaproteobacteria bacterium]